jgi:tRNA(Ile)-lysidine synthase
MDRHAGQTIGVSDSFHRRVAAYVERHGLLPAGTSVLALVSGGADSRALLHALRAVHEGRVVVLTIDHGLRAEAAAETAVVVEAAQLMGCEVVVEHLELTSGTGVQERARTARRDCAERVRHRERLDVIATGHTASDQAETVLFHLARGAGRDGLMGMAPRDGVWIRPLLGVTRDETRAWCRTNGVSFVDDPSNEDPRYARTRLRTKLVPALTAIHPGAEAAVVRAADLLRDEAEVIGPVVAEAWTRCADADGLDVVALTREPPAIQRLLVRRLIGRAGLPGDARWVAAALDLAARGGRPRELPGGLVAVDGGRLVVEGCAAPPPVAAALPVPGTATFADRTITARIGAAPPPGARCVAVRITGPLHVRSVAPGDRIALPGGGRKRVGELLAEAGVPERRRSLVPVVSEGRRVVWIAGYRADPELLAPVAERATVLEVL